MADKLKVFKNAEVTETDSLSSLSIPILTTGVTESAVVKNIKIEMTLNDEDKGFYKYPTKLKMGGVAISDEFNLSGANSASLPATFVGDQIVDNSTTLELEIGTESEKFDYGTSKFFFSRGSELSFMEYAHASINPKDADESSIAAAFQKSKTVSTGSYKLINGRTGTIRESNGVQKMFIADGSGYLQVVDMSGNLLAQVTNWGCNGIAVDDTYVYGTSTTNNTELKRYNHITGLYASSLTTSQNQYFNSTNPGFMDYYNGFVYIRPRGGVASTYVIDVTNGSTTSTNTTSWTDTEFLGGVITVNDYGVPMIVMHGDTNIGVYTLEATPRTWNATSIFPTNPTTTYGCGVICIGNGLVLVDNGSYNQRMIIDVNSIQPNAVGGDIEQTIVTGDITLRTNSSTTIVGSEFKSTITAKPRKLNHKILATGVLSS